MWYIFHILVIMQTLMLYLKCSIKYIFLDGCLNLMWVANYCKFSSVGQRSSLTTNVIRIALMTIFTAIVSIANCHQLGELYCYIWDHINEVHYHIVHIFINIICFWSLSFCFYHHSNKVTDSLPQTLLHSCDDQTFLSSSAPAQALL